MKHYKDPITNELYAYEADGSQDDFIKPGLVQITDAEANSMRAPSEDVLKARCASEAKQRLLDTDWSQLGDVASTLTNKVAFDAYRASVRALVLEPVTAPTFPERPSAVWA